MNEDKKNKLKNLMHDALDEQEKQLLMQEPNVEKLMHAQWEEDLDINLSDHFVENRIWKKITHRINRRAASNQLLIYKIIVIAASFLLLIATGSLVYFNKQQSEQYMYIVSSGVCSIESVSLPDGTEVKLGPNSRLTYPSNFNGKTRDVNLIGQAFFSVAKDKEKPFTVHTDNMDVTALGTSFEVFNYEYENRIEAILLEGKVRVGLGNNIDSKQRKEIILTPDEMLVYDKSDQTVRVKNVNAESYSGWKNLGILSFENERLSTIISRLEPWYGRKIKCPEDIAEEYRFTFKVRDESLERILFMLNNSSPVKYKEINGDYELYVK